LRNNNKSNHLKTKRKPSVSTIVLVLVLCVGLGIMLYPIVASWWNANHQARAIATYQRAVDSLSDEERAQKLKAAEDYNARLFAAPNAFYNPDRVPGYDDQLEVDGSEIIATIAIPKIDVRLPIYKGTDDATLNAGVGHLEGSSLPVGGANTHAVLSGHRGLPGSRLFTDIVQLRKKDYFMISVLGRRLTYRVDRIKTVKPEQVEDLQIVPGKDYVTLFTCTPYGINTHRLLVRGHRVKNLAADDSHISSDAFRISSVMVMSLTALPFVIVLLVVLLRRRRSQKLQR
jgi:sortase A